MSSSMSNMFFDGKSEFLHTHISDFKNVRHALRKLFSEAFLGPCQTSMIEFCVKTILTVNYFCKNLRMDVWEGLNPFQPSVVFHIETSHLFCCAKQMTGFYMKRSTRLKWIKYASEFGIVSKFFFLISNKFKRINQLLFSLKLSENYRFPDDFRRNRSYLVCLNLKAIPYM